LDYLREGDTLVITRLDRLARSAIHLGTLVDSFQKSSINLVVFDQHIDTMQPMGKLMFHLLAGFAEFEWSIRKEQQAEGIEKALGKRVRFGRPHKLTDAH
jgi:DNA invertase Pin-like site-specific DNA recombinase